MSGPVTDASSGAPATDGGSSNDDGHTVAPAILRQHTPSIRYIDPNQSNVIMESGTKSPNVRAPTCSYFATYTAHRPHGSRPATMTAALPEVEISVPPGCWAVCLAFEALSQLGKL